MPTSGGLKFGDYFFFIKHQVFEINLQCIFPKNLKCCFYSEAFSTPLLLIVLHVLGSGLLPSHFLSNLTLYEENDNNNNK